MQRDPERATWGPFDCRPWSYELGEDGSVLTVPCNCGAEHPRLTFDQRLGYPTERSEQGK